MKLLINRVISEMFWAFFVHKKKKSEKEFPSFSFWNSVSIGSLIRAYDKW